MAVLKNTGSGRLKRKAGRRAEIFFLSPHYSREFSEITRYNINNNISFPH
jgi:hypothetical protein